MNERNAPTPETPANIVAPAREPPVMAVVVSKGSGKQWLHRVLPWVSLVMGVISALTMDRGPERAALVAVATVVSWLTLFAMRWAVSLPDDPSRSQRRQRVLAFLRRSTLVATQSALQFGLFFSGPFYWRAAALLLDHALFIGVAAVLSAMTLWDPLSEWLLRRPTLGPLALAFSSFATLNAVLPGFGLSTQLSLWVAAILGAVGVMLMATWGAPAGQRLRTGLWVLLRALLLPLAFSLGAARLVPAAPLRLASIEFGTAAVEHWVAAPVTQLTAAPERLFCATAIASPVGVKDRLFHVWQHAGSEVARIELDIRGGRQAGYRTRSRLAGPQLRAAGRYTCSIETASGQRLGSRSIVIGGT